MDLNRLLRLAGLSRLDEDVTPDPVTNDLIIAYVDQFTGDTWHIVHDAIDVLFSAGPEGLTVADWAARVRQIHPDGADVMTALKGVAQHFVPAGYIRRTDDKRYVWTMPNGLQTEPPAADDLDDVPAHMKQAMSQQVGMTYDALGMIRERGEISGSDWAARLAQRFGMPPAVARDYVAHIVQQFRGVIVPAGPDRFRYQEEAPQQDPMSLFRDIANRPKPLPDDDY